MICASFCSLSKTLSFFHFHTYKKDSESLTESRRLRRSSGMSALIPLLAILALELSYYQSIS